MFSRRQVMRVGLPAVVAALALVPFLAPESAPDPAPSATAPGTAALRATIDPETGTLAIGPAAVDKSAAPELAEMLSRSTRGLREEPLPGGGVKVHLQGRFMSASVARLDGEGAVQTLCTEDREAAEAFLDEADVPRRDANGWEVQ